MVFKCQEDSFLREHVGKVVSCKKATYSPSASRENDIEGYSVILDETIFFPEGGGQPCDYGTLNGKPVRNVIRDGAEAVLFVEGSEAFTEGAQVKQVIDWTRRLDHMQQHSGQHLITALFDQTYNYDTKSWWLGSESSYIELSAADVGKDELDHIEKLANELIFEGRKVTVTVTSVEDGLKFQDIRAPRGLPPDHVGPVRVVAIEGIESNMCCGTHVTNLSQLQAIKLLHVEKAKSKLVVHFLVGNRIVKKLEDCYSRELNLNVLLKGGPPSHLELIQKMQSNLKNSQKTVQKLLRDAAIMESEKLLAMNPLPAYYSLHRRDGFQLDFINTFLRNAPGGVFYFLTTSDTSGKGSMVLRGEPADVAKFGALFSDSLNGKGSGKGSSFQAKINSVAKLSECEAKLKEHFVL